MNWMLKNSAGKPDGVFSLVVGSWIIASVLLGLSVLDGTVKLGDLLDLTLKPVDSTLFVAYMGATFGSYVVRRNTKDKLAAAPEQVEDEK